LKAIILSSYSRRWGHHPLYFTDRLEAASRRHATRLGQVYRPQQFFVKRLLALTFGRDTLPGADGDGPPGFTQQTGAARQYRALRNGIDVNEETMNAEPIVVEQTFRAPIERVWDAISN
jgi:hypothetical protein